MVLPKKAFKKQDPLDDDEILEALEKMESEASGLDAKYESTKGALKILREKRSDLRTRVGSALRAHEAEEPVWLLTDGKLSTEGPDGQGQLLGDEEGDGDEKPRKARSGKDAAAGKD
jgi:hypothetical protein